MDTSAAISSLTLSIPPITPQHTVNEVAELFMSAAYQKLLSLPIVVDNKPVGIITRQKMMEIFIQVFGRDLYGKKPIEHFMSTSPLVIEASESMNNAGHFITEHIKVPITEDFIVTERGSYCGMGIVLDLIRILNEELSIRSEDLAQANEEIIILNSQLAKENRRMSAELDVAKEIQQIVLPRASELESIANLDITGFMVPADEVGGDYYDVFEQNGKLMLGIGDVTGHGLESGIMMLMVQTAVQTLAACRIGKITDVLSILNQVIYNNAERMGSDKNLTLSLLEYSDNVFTVTGQHEEVLVVRKGKVEQVETVELGFMVGMLPDISTAVGQLEIKDLQVGDGIVLFTDGITEALDPNEKLYGLDRLCDAIEQHWHLPSKGVQEAVYADLQAYMNGQYQFDDITLLVIKCV